MTANRYTLAELLLCTYAALYDEREFNGIDAVYNLSHRSRVSIERKMKNIAAMLDEEGVTRNLRIEPLSGLPPGEVGRRTGT